MIFNSEVILKGDFQTIDFIVENSFIEGLPGKNGNTPYIGVNGNWWIGGIDTGVKAQGKDGDANVTKTNVETALSITTDTTPVDTDEVLTLRSGSWLKTTWANIIIFFKTIFQQKTLYFSNKSVLTTDFVADTTYAGYGYKAVITCTGVTSTMLSEVTFSTIDADSGNYASVCLAGTNTVTIYAKAIPSGTITIPTIKSETV